MSLSHPRLYTMLETDDLCSCPAAEICTDGVLPFAAGDDTYGVPGTAASRETLCQLVMLSLRFDRPGVDSGVSTRTLPESCVRSVVDECAGVGCSCIWIAVSVLRTNCVRDMRVCRSATCRSVLSSRSEYETAWTRSSAPLV